MTRREALAGFAIGVGVGRSLRAQESTFSSRIDVVNVNVVVRTATGELVRHLGIEDFTLDESGQAQTIRYFSQEMDTPLTVGLLIDVSASQLRMLDAERRASYVFLEQVLRTGGSPDHPDQAFVIQFDSGVNVRQAPTSFRPSLEAALGRAESPALESRFAPGQGTKLYDAVVAASEQYMSWLHGRKACILLSDGIDHGSASSLAAAIEAARRADTLVYSVLFYDSGAYNSDHTDGMRALQRISEATGARYFEVTRKQTLERIFTEIGDELRSIYILGYTPERSGSGYRSIHVGVKRKDLSVSARAGYYAEGGGPLTDPHAVRIASVDPRTARPGDLITVSGDGLDKSSVSGLLLSDGARTILAEPLEQSATEIKFKAPAQTEPGPWLGGERRPHQWTVVLQTADGNLLLEYAAFKIGIE